MSRRSTINININSKLAGTTMGKNSFEGVLALKRAGLVSMFRTEYQSQIVLVTWFFTWHNFI